MLGYWAYCILPQSGRVKHHSREREVLRNARGGREKEERNMRIGGLLPGRNYYGPISLPEAIVKFNYRPSVGRDGFCRHLDQQPTKIFLSFSAKKINKFLHVALVKINKIGK